VVPRSIPTGIGLESAQLQNDKCSTFQYRDVTSFLNSLLEAFFSLSSVLSEFETQTFFTPHGREVIWLSLYGWAACGRQEWWNDWNGDVQLTMPQSHVSS